MRTVWLTKSDQFNTYNIADSFYCYNIDLPEISAFQVENKEPPQNLTSTSSHSLISLYNNYCDIGESVYKLHVQTNEMGCYHLQACGQSFQIEKSLIRGQCDSFDVNIVLGPVFILNLSQNKTFCFHASAFIINSTAFVLMANSGTGKSTIARFMHAQEKATRLVDDILPIKIIDNRLTLLPRFPQLKLSANDQYKGSNISMKTVFIFAQKSDSKTILKELRPFNGMKKMIQHSVATKLFGRNELKNHLSFCHQASHLSRSFHLGYQHNSSSLKTLYKMLYEIS